MGFTLTELLVTITVVSILAGLAIPTLSRVQDSSLEVRCASNLRQIGIAQTLFSQDNNGDYSYAWYYRNPPSWSNTTAPDGLFQKTWLQRLEPYLRVDQSAVDDIDSVINCPAIASATGATSYGLNKELTSSKWMHKGVRIPEPSQIILVADKETSSFNEFVVALDKNESAPKVALRHRKATRANFLFCDGHVECLSPDDTSWNMPSNQNRWRWW
ncbi:MAG: prepilin-type N-terminal cleavage/methylation domain-containing protein [Verrucomicrobiota bacterium]